MSATADEMLTIAPPRLPSGRSRFIAPTITCMKNSPPLKMIDSISSICASVSSSNLARCPVAAAFTAMSIAPCSVSTLSASAWMAARLVTSQAIAVAPVSAANASSPASPRPATTTVAPSAIKRSAIACPILPRRVAPMMTATLPFSLPMLSSSHWWRRVMGACPAVEVLSVGDPGVRRPFQPEDPVGAQRQFAVGGEGRVHEGQLPRLAHQPRAPLDPLAGLGRAEEVER